MCNHPVLIERKTKRAKNDEQKDKKIVVFKERYYADFRQSLYRRQV